MGAEAVPPGVTRTGEGVVFVDRQPCASTVKAGGAALGKKCVPEAENTPMRGLAAGSVKE